jgi:hypothetical protein
MRTHLFQAAVLSIALASITPAVNACCCDDDCFPTSIKFPKVPKSVIQRGDYLVTMHDNRVVVDLKRGKTFDLGKVEASPWFYIDVADGQALFVNKDRLQVRTLENPKLLHDLPLGKSRVYSLGFVGKGRAFVHHGKTLDILELATGKTLHTIDFGSDDIRWGSNAWQKVGNRLFVAGPETSLCVIDLEAGKLADRFSINAGAGIASIHVEGSLVYCVGSPFSWVPNHHLVCYDMEMKKPFFSDLSKGDRFFGRVAGGPYGTAYLFSGNKIERLTMMGERCGTFNIGEKETVLAVWRGRAVVAGVDEIRLVEIRETPVARTTSAR